MKLRVVNKSCKSVGAFIVFRSNGSSYFSKKLANEMNLEDGDCFSIVNDEDTPLDYYLTKSESGFNVKRYESKKRLITEFHARSLARDFGRFFGVDHKFIKIPVAPMVIIQGREYWPIITAALNNK